MPSFKPSLIRLAAVSVLGLSLPGCAVFAVADVAASAAVGTAGLAVDATLGAVKIGGKVIGKTADMILGGDEK